MIPCFEPVMTMDFGVVSFFRSGRSALMPFIGPKTFVSKI